MDTLAGRLAEAAKFDVDEPGEFAAIVVAALATGRFAELEHTLDRVAPGAPFAGLQVLRADLAARRDGSRSIACSTSIGN